MGNSTFVQALFHSGVRNTQPKLLASIGDVEGKTDIKLNIVKYILCLMSEMDLKELKCICYMMT